MAPRTKNQIVTSVLRAISAASPQVRVDVDNGPFYFLSAQGVAQPLADASTDIERVAQLSTLQFPAVATDAEALATARAFGETQGAGGYASGYAYVFTSREPTGTDSFGVAEGDTFTTTRGSGGGITVAAVESRALTAANAAAFFNPARRRYELPVLCRALTAGTTGNLPALTLTQILGGATGFDGVTNLTAFSGGSAPQDVRMLYARVQTKLAGLDLFSRGGMVSRALAFDTERIQAVSLTYSSEFPSLFYRLPDGLAVDLWVLNTARPVTTTETFVATAGQTAFTLSSRPVLGLTGAFVNGTSVTASLVLDESDELGRSTQEASYVSLAVPAASGDFVDVTYSYDGVLADLQLALAGYANTDTGALFATDVLVRYARQMPVLVSVTGTVLGTFDPTTIEQQVTEVVGAYLPNGLDTVAALGGVRYPAELRDQIRSLVPGIANLSIPVFGRKSLGIVEVIDVPRHSTLVLEATDDLVVRFT